MDRGAGILSNHSKNYFPESDPHSSGSRVMPIRSRKSSPPHVSGHHGHTTHGTGSGVHHPCINSQNTIQLGAHAATSNACHTARDTRFKQRDTGVREVFKDFTSSRICPFSELRDSTALFFSRNSSRNFNGRYRRDHLKGTTWSI